MFDVDAWLARCKTCLHSREESSYGTTCSLKGSCQFEKIPELENLNKFVAQSQQEVFICCRCKQVFEKADMSRQSCRGKSYYRYCKPCKNYMTQDAINRRIEKYVAQHGVEVATCRLCKQTKGLAEFSAVIGKYGDISFKTCKKCLSQYNRNRFLKKRGNLDD